MSESQGEHRTEQEKEPILQCPYTDNATLDCENISVFNQIGFLDSDSCSKYRYQDNSIICFSCTSEKQVQSVLWTSCGSTEEAASTVTQEHIQSEKRLDPEQVFCLPTDGINVVCLPLQVPLVLNMHFPGLE